MKPNSNKDDGSSGLVLPRLSWSVPCIKSALTKHKGWLIVTGDSLLKGTEGSKRRTHFSGKSLASLRPGLKMWGESFLSWYGTHIIDFFFFFQVVSGEVVTRSVRAMKRNFRALVKESGAQVVCISILPVAGNDDDATRPSGDRQCTPIPKGEKYLCTGVRQAH